MIRADFARYAACGCLPAWMPLGSPSLLFDIVVLALTIVVVANLAKQSRGFEICSPSEIDTFAGMTGSKERAAL